MYLNPFQPLVSVCLGFFLIFVCLVMVIAAGLLASLHQTFALIALWYKEEVLLTVNVNDNTDTTTLVVRQLMTPRLGQNLESDTIGLCWELTSLFRSDYRVLRARTTFMLVATCLTWLLFTWGSSRSFGKRVNPRLNIEIIMTCHT
jgi:hypothetical protein